MHAILNKIPNLYYFVHVYLEGFIFMIIIFFTVGKAIYMYDYNSCENTENTLDNADPKSCRFLEKF